MGKYVIYHLHNAQIGIFGCNRSITKPNYKFTSEIENVSCTECKKQIANTKAKRIKRAVHHHGFIWPENLTSDVMFFEGLKITKEEFDNSWRG